VAADVRVDERELAAVVVAREEVDLVLGVLAVAVTDVVLAETRRKFGLAHESRGCSQREREMRENSLVGIKRRRDYLHRPAVVPYVHLLGPARDAQPVVDPLEPAALLQAGEDVVLVLALPAVVPAAVRCVVGVPNSRPVEEAVVRVDEVEGAAVGVGPEEVYLVRAGEAVVLADVVGVVGVPLF